MLQSFPSVRLVALDLDGTLLSRNNEVTPATREAIAAGDKAAAEAAYKVAAQKLDKAAGAGVIHKNQAANRKSGLAKLVNSINA